MYAVGNNCEVEKFSEPKLVTGEATFMDKVREKGMGKAFDEEDDKLSECSGHSSDESVRDVHFDDSEEERMKRFDEGVDAVNEVQLKKTKKNEKKLGFSVEEDEVELKKTKWS
ncbi:hypothetical protein KIW84_072956 [Lathyrus oleraceus]|uniref:Uncharacterized protein n=1 Tax=Pisum sativum TaxID=3888 RepID=A0A9D4ZWN6_PEA|nr:hypothetical protein KIW84_072956 [Pisum sativum]